MYGCNARPFHKTDLLHTRHKAPTMQITPRYRSWCMGPTMYRQIPMQIETRAAIALRWGGKSLYLCNGVSYSTEGRPVEQNDQSLWQTHAGRNLPFELGIKDSTGTVWEIEKWWRSFRLLKLLGINRHTHGLLALRKWWKRENRPNLCSGKNEVLYNGHEFKVCEKSSLRIFPSRTSFENSKKYTKQNKDFEFEIIVQRCIVVPFTEKKFYTCYLESRLRLQKK